MMLLQFTFNLVFLIFLTQPDPAVEKCGGPDLVLKILIGTGWLLFLVGTSLIVYMLATGEISFAYFALHPFVKVGQ
ncbi:MAG: hypothetical protein LBQ97_02450 [Fusobacteriaceae bacterium]|nr:hypothetical protein [Fusobacteriaceae bacterium]